MSRETDVHPALFTIGSKHGRDIRMESSSDRPPLVELPLTQDSRIASLLLRTAKETEQFFDNYDYPVFIKDSRMVDYMADGIGTEIYTMEVIALGDHTVNGFGSYIPREDTWNGKEPETRLYARSSSTPWKREQLTLSLLSHHAGDHLHAFRIAEKLSHDDTKQQRIDEIVSRGYKYLERSNKSIPSEADVFSLTGD